MLASVAPRASLAAHPVLEWDQQSPTSSPSARDSASMAYDPATGEMVLFGGLSGGYLGETWTYDGSVWEEQHPVNSPPAGSEGTMAYDPATDELVLFCGIGQNGSPGETWTYNGSTWTEQHPANSPVGRQGAPMAYDPVTGEMVLFGGYGDAVGPLGETWTYNGSTWTEQHPASSPTAREAHSMAYDPVTDEMVLFGGYNNEIGALAETWTYNGSTWTKQSPANSPSPREEPLMQYDPVTKEMVVFGGHDNETGFLGETWAYNNSTWTEMSLANSPAGRDGASMAYDPGIETMVLFGGYGTAGYLGETWTYGPMKGYPSLSTNASTSVPIGGEVHDEASLSGGRAPGGTIVFELYGPGDESCTSTTAYTSSAVPVSGDGRYQSGEFAPSTPGVYRWVASYSGDSDNEAAAGTCGEAGETVSVSKASVSMSTNASDGVVLGGKVHDEALLSGGSSPGGSITFTLYGPEDGSCASPPVYASVAVAVSGDGSYQSGEFVPSAPGVYRWIASYSGDSDDEATAGVCREAGETATVSSDPAAPNAPNPPAPPQERPPVEVTGPVLAPQLASSAWMPSDVTMIGAGDTIVVHGDMAVVPIKCRSAVFCTGVADIQSGVYSTRADVIYAHTRYTISAGRTTVVLVALGNAGMKLVSHGKRGQAYLYLHPSGGLPAGTLFVGGEIQLVVHGRHRT